MPNTVDQRFASTEVETSDETVLRWERIALGKLLLMPDAVEHLLTLGHDDFLLPAHQHIYAAIVARTESSVDNNGVLADVIGVRSVMAQGDPMSYLSRIRSEGVDAVGTYGFHAGRIKEASELRRIVKATEEARRAAGAGNREAAIAALASVVKRAERADADVGEDNPMASWLPVDVSPVLSGTFEPVRPQLGRRDDGTRMFYRAKEHAVASEPECGKTWWLLMQVMSVLQEGGRVVYVDFEDDENTIVGRLLMLGCLPRLLGPSTFRYVRPEAKPTTSALRFLMTFGKDLGPDLVVYDGVTEGMSLLGMEINEQESAAEWRRVFVKPALRLGAATISTDHVVKNKESRGRFAIGAQHKLAGLNGVMFLMESVKPFGAGIKGSSRVLISKDRNGGLRQFGKPVEGGKTHIGDLIGDCTADSDPSWRFFAPYEESTPPEGTAAEVDPHAPAGPPEKIRDAVQAVIGFLSTHPASSGRAVRANVNYRDVTVSSALEWLVSNDHVTEVPGPRNASYYTLTDQVDD